MPFDNATYNLFLDIINAKNDDVISKFEEPELDVHTKLNKYGWTPLHAAAYKGNVTLVKYFLAKGANKDFENMSGKTPTMLALEEGHTEIVELMEQIQFPLRTREESCQLSEFQSASSN